MTSKRKSLAAVYSKTNTVDSVDGKQQGQQCKAFETCTADAGISAVIKLDAGLLQ